ncbi:MAG: hypothetical protein HOK63_05655 [Thaumarchaeota archaeon]|jgi:hypothetical protein|nr:hypothetical protein [Nitrososphaerota archaeon]MBT6469116.1 hypothetical protein [Nitrososphaerota archaeon]
MKRIFYVLPVIAFVLIFTNAFFGHLIFGSPYDQEINKYSIYVHLQQDWNSYPGNILFDVTQVWSNPNDDKNNFSKNPSDISSLINYNSNQLQYQNNKSFVELKHEFSNCESNWQPMLYRYVVDNFRSKINSVKGTQLNDDPYISIFPNIKNHNHDDEKQHELLTHGYAQFIPICTVNEFSSYEYSILLNDEKIAFDVYFIPSENEISNYFTLDSFEFYSEKGCFAENYHSFNGICNNVGKDAGLLIVLPDNLESSLTKVVISIHEKI